MGTTPSKKTAKKSEQENQQQGLTTPSEKTAKKSEQENQQQELTTQNRSNTDRLKLQGSTTSEDDPPPSVPDRQTTVRRVESPSTHTRTRSNTDRLKLQGSTTSEDDPPPSVPDRQTTVRRVESPSTHTRTRSNQPKSPSTHTRTRSNQPKSPSTHTRTRSNQPKSPTERTPTRSINSTISSTKDRQENNGSQVTVKSGSIRDNDDQSPIRRSPDLFTNVVDQRETVSKLSTNHSTHREEKPSATYPRQTDHCSKCPHCQRQAIRRQMSPQPAWFIENPDTDHRHIIMDNYDEDAIREKVISEDGHLPGSYDYLPNLTIDEKKDDDGTTIKYYTLPAIAKLGPPISPTRTPFPNYAALDRREQRLNKPFKLTLFTD